MLLPWLAMQLNRPVKWIEDRSENFYATTQERVQFHEAELAITKDGKILGVKDVFWHDNGAYDPYGLTVPINTQCTLLNMYHVPTASSPRCSPTSRWSAHIVAQDASTAST
jgi:CO/xanthine dehydrogenase Mo-binding subunit